MRQYALILCLLSAFLVRAADEMRDYTRWVNPMIGSDGHGHVFVGANVPFGFVNVGPNQMGTGWDWCSGYHFSDSTIAGFGQLHLSGTGCGDLGDVSLMPVTRNFSLSRGTQADPKSGFYSAFSHSDEWVRPGYYAVWLKRYNIKAEMSATSRAAFHKYTYPAGDSSQVVIDLTMGLGWNRMTDCRLNRVDDYTLSGYRTSRGWAANRTLYFVIRFSKPIVRWMTSKGDAKNGNEQAYGLATFALRSDSVVCAKVGLSAVSEQGAMKNLDGEMASWDFASVVSCATAAWNRELGKIDAEFASEREMRIFYTSLYHTMIAPSLFCDVDLTYRGTDGKNHSDDGIPNYTTFSLWDTYRGAHPLATLIHSEQQVGWARSLLRMYREQGFLPIWPLMANETGCMVGSPAVPVLADLFLKGLVRDTAYYDAMKNSMMLDMRGLSYLKSLGYIPYDKENESVSKNLENYLADWSVSMVAARLKRKEDADYFRKRSQGYRKIYDSRSGFFRGKSSEGLFRPDSAFNPCHQTKDYTEGTPWQYLWLVPHDVPGLIHLMGGKRRFERRLDSLFVVSSDLGTDHNPDISGLIGQYAHGNEPSHHVAYLYNYVGRPEKTGKRVREVMQTFYTDMPDGICGNEDVGQMSAWYVLSAIGFYPVEPCGGIYQIGSPTVRRAEVNVGAGRSLRIITYNNSERSCYIRQIKLNGKKYPYTYLRHEDLVKGGLLEFYMSETPSRYGHR